MSKLHFSESRQSTFILINLIWVLDGQHQIFLVTELCRMWRSSWGRDYKVSWPRIIQRGRLKVLQLLRSQDSLSSQVTHLKLSQLSLESECFIKDNVYDGYNNDTFLMFVPTICIISSHKLSSARIRHEADMSSHENIIEYIHTLSDASLANLQSTFHRLYTIISWLR